MKFNIILFFIFCVLQTELLANIKNAKEVNASLGMSIINWTETASSISGVGNVDQVESGSTSVITARVSFDLYTGYNYKWLIEGFVPLIASGGQSYYAGGVSWQYYFSSRAGRVKIENADKTIFLINKFKYFVGVDLGVANVTYLTETAKKQDTFFEIGPSAGLQYRMNEKWTVTSDLKISRGTGSATTSFNYKAFVGVRYFYGYED